MPTTYYLLATAHTYHLLLVTYYSLLATYYRLLTTHHSPLTTHHSPPTTTHQVRNVMDYFTKQRQTLLFRRA